MVVIHEVDPEFVLSWFEVCGQFELEFFRESGFCVLLFWVFVVKHNVIMAFARCVFGTVDNFFEEKVFGGDVECEYITGFARRFVDGSRDFGFGAAFDEDGDGGLDRGIEWAAVVIDECDDEGMIPGGDVGHGNFDA